MGVSNADGDKQTWVTFWRHNSDVYWDTWCRIWGNMGNWGSSYLYLKLLYGWSGICWSVADLLCIHVYVSVWYEKRPRVLFLRFLKFEEVKWSEVTESCLTLCDPMDCSLLGSSFHGIFQARILEWVTISFSRRSSRPRDWTQVSHIVGRHFTVWATREVIVKFEIHVKIEMTVRYQNGKGA